VAVVSSAPWPPRPLPLFVRPPWSSTVVTVVDEVVDRVVVGTVVTTDDAVGAAAVVTVDLGWVTAVGSGAGAGRSSVVGGVAGWVVATTPTDVAGAGADVEVVCSVVGTKTGAGVVLTDPAAARATPPAIITNTMAQAVIVARRI